VKLILTIQNILQEWQEFFRGSVVGEVYSKETSDTIVKLQSPEFLYERIDEAAIAVRPYQPKCHLETVAAFQMQKYARDRLKILINGLREIVDLMDELYPEERTTVVASKPLLLPVAQTEEKTNKGWKNRIEITHKTDTERGLSLCHSSSGLTGTHQSGWLRE